ncbi:MAG: hypothetical protein Kow00127_00230 [Bacteroidales bacterium]
MFFSTEKGIDFQISALTARDQAGEDYLTLTIQLHDHPLASEDIHIEVPEILQSIPGLYFRCKYEPGFPIILVNRYSEEVTGYTAEELMKLGRFDKIILPEERQRVWELTGQQLERGNFYELQYRIADKEGNKRTLWERGHKISTHDGRVLEGIILDITEILQAKEQVREAEKRYRMITENSLDVIWSTGTDLCLNFVSPSITKLTGFKPEEIINKPLLELAHRDSYERVQMQIRKYLPRLLEGEKLNLSVEVKHQTLDGNGVWTEISLTSLHNHKKEFTGILGVTRDITERRSIRKLLQESENRFRQVLETIELLAISFDMNGKLYYANPWFLKLCSLTTKEIIGRPWVDKVIPIEYRNNTKKRLFDIAPGKHPGQQHFECPIMGANKKRLWIRWNIVYHYHEASKSWHATAIGENITEIRKNQQRIEELNKVLEQKVRRRTEALLESNKSLESFAYSISHDLRAPLRHISGFSGMLSERLDPANREASEYLEKINHSVKTMQGMIDALLGFSRIGRKTINRVTLNIHQLVLEIIESYKIETSNRKIHLALGPFIPVEGDYTLIKMALENLISNALKFTRTRDEALIRIWMRKNNNYISISIRDNGVGFDPEYSDRLFGVFQRLHPVEKYDGNGIGLANVQRIIHRHGGKVAAEGLPGEGAVFTIELPESTSFLEDEQSLADISLNHETK